MAIRSQEVDIERDRQSLISLLQESLPGHGGAAHFDWLYRDNPAGKARAWVALSDGSDDPIGAAAAFPRRMWVRGNRTLCWNLGDFAIKKQYRTLGPAVILQRACLQSVLEGLVPFAYDHPSCSMMAIYKRMGIAETGQVVRFAKLLRVDEKVGKVLKGSALSSGVSGLGNVVLSIADRGLLVRRRHEAGSLQGRFDDAVTDLERRIAPTLQVVGGRDAEYLNWRYVDNPLGKYEILTVEGEDRLRGYVVVRHEGDNASLSDLYAEDDPSVGDALLAGAIESLRGKQIGTLSAPVLEGSALVPLLKRWGFHPRESHPFVVSAPPGAELSQTVSEAGNWFLTAGDRDV